MKTFSILSASLALAATAFPAETNTISAELKRPRIEPPPGLERYLTKPPEEQVANPTVGTTFFLGGTFVTLAKRPNPWQMLNPFAPARYGDGTDHVSVHPYTGAAEGTILFSIGFPAKGVNRQRSQAAPRAGASELPRK